ncbi:MAG: penicillin-binding protein 2 [Patescibacteria group bacterium]
MPDERSSPIRLVVHRTGDRFDVTDAAAQDPAAAAERPQYLGVAISRRRLSVLFLLLLCAFGILTARAAQLQVFSGEEHRTRAERNRIRMLPTPAVRGVFFDRTGTPLVSNVPSFALTVTAADLPEDATEREQLLTEAAGLAHMDAADLTAAVVEARRTPYVPVTVKSEVVYDDAIRLAVEAERLPGIGVAVDTVRNYAGSPGLVSLGHLFGYVGKITEDAYAAAVPGTYLLNDRIGRSGIEAAFETLLRGRFGTRQVEVDALGREQRIISEQVPVDGASIRLSLDLAAQEKLEQILAAVIRRTGRTRAAAVALDPRDGGVIALVSMPGYDQNLFAGGVSSSTYRALNTDNDRPLFARAISGLYPSGSTIKPLVAAAALEAGVITAQTTVLSTGGIHYGAWFFPDWKAGGHGRTDVRKALAESVNTFFYMIGGGTETFPGLGIDRLSVWLKRFGLGTTTGIELPGEAAGLVPTPEWKERVKGEAWVIGDTYHAAIGQGDVLVTPLQMAVVTQAFANGGTIYAPHLLAAKTGRDGESLTEPKKLAYDFLSPQTLDVVRQGMRQTVTAGSAPSLQTVPVAVAGKTGTAQGRSDRPTHAWFTGFAPYDRPEIVITVLIEEGGEGSSVAVPVAREFLSWYFGPERREPSTEALDGP